MASTSFVNGVTLTDAGWFNDTNAITYVVFNADTTRASGRHTLLAGMDAVTNTLGSDVALNNTSNYFDGPSCAQGTSGTWLAFGVVTVNDTAGAAIIDAKLHDGTTIIASGSAVIAASNGRVVIHLSGTLATPAGNIKISVKDESSASGNIKFNASGNSKDATLTVIRIA